MSQKVFTVDADFDISGAAVDGNPRLVKSDNVELDLWKDVFGSVFDTNHWTENGEVFHAGSAAITKSLAESGGTLAISASGTDAWRVWGTESDLLFAGDFDIQVDCSITWNLTVSYQTVGLIITKDSAGSSDKTNEVRVDYSKKTGAHIVQAAKVVAGAVVDNMSDAVTSNTPKFRITRSGTTINCYYDDGAGWVLADTYDYDMGNVHIVLYVASYVNASQVSCNFNNFVQNSGGVYWNDSPPAKFKKSGEDYTIDIGSGRKLNIDSFSVTTSEPAGTSIKYRWVKDDNGSWPGAGWSSWLTAAEFNTAITNGDLDGLQYIYVEFQLNSDATDKCSLSDGTFDFTTLIRKSVDAGTVNKLVDDGVLAKMVG